MKSIDTSGSETRSRFGGVFALGIQLALLAGAAAWGVWQARADYRVRALPPLRTEPYAVPPLYDDPAVVSDEDLRRVLPRLGLRGKGAQTVIGHVEHGLRAWGPGVRFADPSFLSGQDMLRLVTDNWRFLGTYGPKQRSLLYAGSDGETTGTTGREEEQGVRVRVLEGIASSPHVDHLLASLAEAGTSLDYSIVAPGQRTTLRAILEQSLRTFDLNQAEYEWSALTYALYLPPARSWQTSEGREMTFDRLAGRIMREELPRGVCSGNHRLHALVILLRIDDRMAKEGAPRILSPAIRRRVISYLREATAMLVRHQHPDGFWNGDWPTATPALAEPSGRTGDRLSDRIIVTGHVLEWWSLAPPEILPPRAVRAAAGHWLVRTIDGMSADQIQTNFSFLSHAGRALAQWRGRLPAEVLARARAEGARSKEAK
ncbi:MAG TPA: hypothetical protein VGS22_12510 [Thermoanaerobaculia bacterium]|jgi:hypothetical protein|nr:hypothetical protein [Thermoanaerobaculia bacterium]